MRQGNLKNWLQSNNIEETLMGGGEGSKFTASDDKNNTSYNTSDCFPKQGHIFVC